MIFFIIIKELGLKLGDRKRFLQYTPAATAPSPVHVRCNDEGRCNDVLVLCDIPESADGFDVSHIEYVRPIHQLESAFKVAGESVGVGALFDSAAAMSAETKVCMCSACLLARVPFPCGVYFGRVLFLLLPTVANFISVVCISVACGSSCCQRSLTLFPCGVYFGLGRVLFLLLPTATNIQPTFLAIVQNALKGGIPALVWLTIGENVCTLPSQRVMFAHIV